MSHLSVMLEEALHHLAIKPNGVYIDGTFGRGGHSQRILETLGENGQLIAFDRDETAINCERAQKLSQDSRFKLVHAPFSEMENIALQLNLNEKVDGILLDLGVSSPQLDDETRGFSFMNDGALDMRMDTSQGLSAAQWLSQIDEKTLIQVLFDYGEERFARRIANAIVTTRLTHPIETTRQLAKLIEDTIPFREKHKHPATRSFQAIRIAVNNELGELESALKQSINLLNSNGRLVVISFHSLEDRIVKRFMRDESGVKRNVGKLPIKEADIEKGVLNVLSKAIKPTADEIKQNPRSRSAVLRVAERV
ncbi:MAG: 16S rRNA (cytosine(1402)-N(4))-methyltransferase RsmH [Methylococcales bacterium]|nr:16S rRNA (cytosine(1402)-N(4))-methyltransferase RsmH [Methylococcales bacterium]